jgi:hypothetical protein
VSKFFERSTLSAFPVKVKHFIDRVDPKSVSCMDLKILRCEAELSLSFAEDPMMSFP